MATRIRSHITVLRRVSDPDAVARALGSNGTARPCRVRLGGVRRADPFRTGGIYLAVADPHGDLKNLRVVVGSTCKGDADAVQELGHVTLVHPRTTSPEHRDKAWEKLRTWDFTEEVVIRSLGIIGETEEGWSAVASFQLSDM